MKIRIFFLFVGIILSSQVVAQTAPDTLWTKTYGGSYTDHSYSIQLTTDGGYVIVGYTESYGAGNSDFWIIKTNEIGIEEWNQTYGGNSSDVAHSVQQTFDGGFIIAGFTWSYGAGNFDVWIVKTDESGNEVWNQTYGGSYFDLAFSIQQTSDGGYIIAGETETNVTSSKDFWLIKIDEYGNEEWNQIYGGSDQDRAYSVQQTIDGGYIVAGYTESYGMGNSDFWIVKADENGIEEWNQTYGGNYFDKAYSIIQTTDGGYIIAGYTESYGVGVSDFWIVKTDDSGNEEWNQTYGGDYFDRANSIQQTSDGGYIIAGYTESYGTGQVDFLLVKIDASGTEEWNQTYGGNGYDYAYSVRQVTDDGYVVAGGTESYGSGLYDIWLIRLGAENDINFDNISNNQANHFSNYPNPFNPETTIVFSIQNDSKVELAIYNIKGQKINTLINSEFTTGFHSIIWNGDDNLGKPVSSGIYYYKLNVNGKTEAVKKCLFLK
ncbi:MAG: T9SS type A sorting domain-containing protein [Candidatus Cloacimonadota bacterium]|nr:T9SS type A sorting domain-containing protein [Candidatus Cloacimonadota bacterium]